MCDLDSGVASKLANISSRGRVQTGDDVMIGRFIVGGGGRGASKVVVRAIGPSLPVPGKLEDPILELRPSLDRAFALSGSKRISILAS